MLAEIDDITEE